MAGTSGNFHESPCDKNRERVMGVLEGFWKASEMHRFARMLYAMTKEPDLTILRTDPNAQ